LRFQLNLIWLTRERAADQLKVVPTRRLNDTPGLPKPTFALRGRRNEHSKYIIAPALLTGNPVGVNGVHADQHASDHHRVGG
jgi:hypothetical protein